MPWSAHTLACGPPIRALFAFVSVPLILIRTGLFIIPGVDCLGGKERATGPVPRLVLLQGEASLTLV